MRYLLTPALFVVVFLAQAQPDYILYNGKIFTSDNRALYVEALAVTKNKITATGTSIEILKLAGASTQKIDLQRKTVTPGFNDAHFHHVPPTKGRHINFRVPGPNAPERRVVEDSITRLVKTLPHGTWITARLDEHVLNDKSFDRFALDRIAPHHPVRLIGYWGHLSVLNSEALRYYKFFDHTPDTKAGYFERSSDTGIINGRIYDNAQYLADDYEQALITDEAFVASLQHLSDEALSYGITSIQNMCTFASPERYAGLWEKTKAPIRFRLIRWANMNSRNELTIPNHAKTTGLPLVRSSGTKWMIEGTPLEKNAFYKAGYLEPKGWKGRIFFTKADIRAMLLKSIEQNDQCIFHLAGDSLTEIVLSAMKDITTVDWRKVRVRFEHGTILDPEMVKKIKALGIIVVINPAHAGVGDAPPFLNPGSEDDLDRVKSILDENIPVAIGSDGPLNPFLNIMLAVLRKTETITVEQAVIAYTKTSAYAEFADDKGTLAPGKVADLVVLSQDIFTIPPPQLPGTRSLLTMIDGKIVHSTKELNAGKH